MNIHREDNPEGVLYNEVIVFTGRLGIPRREAAAIAADIGCRVESGVTKKNNSADYRWSGQKETCRLRKKFSAQKSGRTQRKRYSDQNS